MSINNNFLIILNWIEHISTSIIIILLILGWLYFSTCNRRKKYNLHELAGIIGVPISFFSLILILYSNKPFIHNLGLVLLTVSFFFSLYCISVPLYSWIDSKFKEGKWEKNFLSTITFGLIFYFSSGYANIRINEIFKIDSSYFEFTKPIAMLLCLSPIISIISFIGIIVIFFLEYNKNKCSSQKTSYNSDFLNGNITPQIYRYSSLKPNGIFDNQFTSKFIKEHKIGKYTCSSKYTCSIIDVEKNEFFFQIKNLNSQNQKNINSIKKINSFTKGKWIKEVHNSFYNINAFTMLYSCLIISLTMTINTNRIIETFASTFDFNEKSQCIFKEGEYNGYIILDPAQSKVLTYKKIGENKKFSYTIHNCEF